MRNIVLIGPMGSGKTAVGRIVAERLGRTFVDLDAMAEARAGCSIPELFAAQGETHFRDLESALCREVAARDGLVIATGGGVVTRAENIRVLSTTGDLFGLRASADTILARVGHETHRPLLQGDDTRARIVALLTARKPLYDAVPNPIETDGRTPEDIADRIVQHVQRGI